LSRSWREARRILSLPHTDFVAAVRAAPDVVIRHLLRELEISLRDHRTILREVIAEAEEARRAGLA